MNTFLPYPDFVQSARVLDRQRLGKQRVETLQLLNALTGRSKGWVNHPATRMWRGYELYLASYGIVMCQEWIARGYKDTCLDKIAAFTLYPITDGPAWLGDPALHASHRSNLLRKAPEYYSQFNWSEPDDMDYVWPV